MAETLDSCSSSDSEPEGPPRKPLPKRRRFLSDTAVLAVPVYSSKVQNSLQLFPESLKLPVQVPLVSSALQVQGRSDEEEEAAAVTPSEQEKRSPVLPPSPPPPPQPQRRSSRCPGTHIIDQRLRNLKSTLSAVKESLQDDGSGFDEDDVILIDSPEPSESRELILKIRCRADLYRVSVQMTDPLQRVVEHMGQTLKVHPSRILLLLRDRELTTDATPRGLGLGVADIIDCVVETTGEESDERGSLQLRVQGKDKRSHMEITVQRNEPLRALMSHYRQAQGLGRRKLAFYFDGRRLAENWTPEEAGMECGDVIEVWN
ncbi:NFATC2-interacting protein isoform X2 [Eublepharis macularius]|uniref:NFATC2-interacting protein n=1 Tax=Eublepharis macularius TaxID=481883 RepID=A0AA97K5A8_EUBMA|nr:NFATC2-interacting protein isoform X2 [Eublepharis macularius]